jgi:N-acetylglutamate synthase-like GNAT family acetyltransferase
MGNEGFLLRPATAKDADSIYSLIHRVKINPWGLDWRRFLVAVDAHDRLVGCGQLKPHGSEIIELASIAVEPEFRHKGVARLLIDALIAQAPRPLYLTCRSSLAPLYAKWAFREMALPEMPPYFQRLARAMAVITAMARMGDHLSVMVLK